MIEEAKMNFKSVDAKPHKNKYVFPVICLILLLFYALAILIPFYIMFITALKTTKESMNPQFTWWPQQGFSLEGFRRVLVDDMAGGGGKGIFKKRIKGLHVKNVPVILLSGILLGLFSAFLGIGGGPINLVLLYILFSLGLKEAAFGSLFVIAVSQTASLILTIAMGIPSFNAYDLVAMILGGVGGGLIGSAVLKRISVNKAEMVYIVMIVAIIGICIFNIVRSAL